MLNPLKTLEIKLTQLLEYVAQVRANNAQLQADNIALRTENQNLLENMQQAQQRVDQIILELETHAAGQS